jgi:hypothetical protein
MPSKQTFTMATDKRRDTAQYWEARLKRMGLTVERAGPDWLIYGHDVSKLDTDGRKTFVPITGETEELEWPMSLC